MDLENQAIILDQLCDALSEELARSRGHGEGEELVAISGAHMHPLEQLKDILEATKADLSELRAQTRSETQPAVSLKLVAGG